MDNILIIADVAGEYAALMELLKKVPNEKKENLIFVGDLNDRGPKSKEVIKFAMEASNAITLHSNHSDMLIDFCLKKGKYEYGIWLDPRNGGQKTIRSYKGTIPREVVAWLSTRPMRYETENLLITHAPISPHPELEPDYKFGEFWNRNIPVPIPGKLQVFGHCGRWGIRRFEDDGKLFAICIDQSYKKILTGMHFPSLELFEVPF